MKDPYSVLGVSKSASDDEIRTAFKKQARKYHPDVNQGNKAAEERFKNVTAANDILSDKTKRKNWDEFGETSLNSNFDAQKARAYQNFGGGGARRGGGGGGPGGFDLGDIFGDLFGGGGGGQRGGPQRGGGFGFNPQQTRGQDLTVKVDVDFVQALRGTEITLGTPAEAACSACGGGGKNPNSPGFPCITCGGNGRSRDKVTVRIPPGADNGSQLRVTGRGTPGQHGGPAGDLLIETRVRPHEHFRREGLDLYVKLPLKMCEALNGAKLPVTTLDGEVNLKIPAHSQSGEKLRLRGKGVKRGKKQGDLYVELQIMLPTENLKALEKALKKTNELYDEDFRPKVLL